MIKKVLFVIMALCAAAFGLVGALLTIAGNDLSPAWATLAYAGIPTLFVFGVWGMFYGLPSSAGRTGVVQLADLPSTLELSTPDQSQLIRVGVVRQSGNEARAFGVQTREEAIHEVQKLFRRKGLDEVRIWKNRADYSDVRATHYHGRGSREGRVIRGATLRLQAR